MIFAGKSDVGRKRTTNQDNFIIKRICSNATLLVVCDGMGGAAGGNIASGIAVEVISDCVADTIRKEATKGIFTPERKTVGFMFNTAMTKANSAVFGVASSTPVLQGMGTTAVCAFICNGIITVSNIGDSRIYYISKNKTEQISHDHSYVQYLIDMGEITEEAAKESTRKNIITRALGVEETVSADIFEREAISGDYLLLCTDGLTNYLNQNEIASIINDSTKDINSKLDMLIAMANNRGGADNITALLAQL